MSAQTEIPIGDPMRDAWEAHKLTDDYRNSLRWAIDGEPQHISGSLWALFVEGWKARDKIDSLSARLADEQAKRIEAERRLSTVPEDFGPLIDDLEAVCDPPYALRHGPIAEWEAAHSQARAALTEKIAALQFRLEAYQKLCPSVQDLETGEWLHPESTIQVGLGRYRKLLDDVDTLEDRLHSAELLLSRASGRLADGEELAPRAGQLIEDIADYFNKQRVVENLETEARCPVCNGNDASKPCAYPREKPTGCLYAARRAQSECSGGLVAQRRGVHPRRLAAIAFKIRVLSLPRSYVFLPVPECEFVTPSC